MNIRKPSVALLITVSNVVVLTICMVILGVIINMISAERWHERLQFDEISIADQLAVSLALPLWNFDYPQIDKIIDSTMQNKAVFSIVVVPSNAAERLYGKTRDKDWRITPVDKTVPPNSMRIQERDLLFGNEKIGRVTVLITQKFLDKFLERNWQVILGTLLPVLLVMATSLYLVLSRLVVRPLREAESFAIAVSSGQECTRPAKLRHYYGELENVRQSIDYMVVTLQSRNQELLSEIELRHASEERFRMLFEQNPAPILIYERNSFSILAINQAFLDLYGYGREEVLTRTIRDFFSEEDRANVLQVTAHLAAGIYEKEWRTYRKDGAPLVIFIRSTDISFLGRDARIVAITDITERRQLEDELHCQTVLLEQELAERQLAQEALQQKTALLKQEIEQRRRLEESERRLLSAVAQSPVSIVITNPKGEIEFVNPKFTQVTGYEIDEVLGQNPRILKTDHTPAEEYQRLWSTISAGNVWEGEFQNKKKNGELFWEHATISPLKNVDGAITNYLAIKEDITNRRLLEEQLRQSQKMESIGRLAGGVAHDFNNMLSVIIGTADLAKGMVQEEEPLFHYLKHILKAAERSATITRQLLAFSRKDVVAPKPINLNALVIESEKMLCRLTGEDIKFNFKPTTGLWTAMIDPSQLDQILMNLTVNARDAMSGGGSLTIETANVTVANAPSQYHADAPPGDYVQLSLSDTGCGMSQETMSHIFEPFFTTKSVGEGTGLGLATVYGIVAQNNGFITVESELGNGTKFNIFLPRLHNEAEECECVDTVPLSGTGTILLVEDEEMLLWTTTRMLEDIGYTVIQAPSPGEALAICEKQGEQIDLILTDVVMPEMNGREMIEQIKKVRAETKALFMSGYSADIVAKRGFIRDGMNYIAKPIDIKELHAKIKEVLA